MFLDKETGQIHLFKETQHLVARVGPSIAPTREETLNEHAAELLSPMPCKISSLSVKVGDRIKKGTTVAILEAMKMEVLPLSTL